MRPPFQVVLRQWVQSRSLSETGFIRLAPTLPFDLLPLLCGGLPTFRQSWLILRALTLTGKILDMKKNRLQDCPERIGTLSRLKRLELDGEMDDGSGENTRTVVSKPKVVFAFDGV